MAASNRLHLAAYVRLWHEADQLDRSLLRQQLTQSGRWLRLADLLTRARLLHTPSDGIWLVATQSGGRSGRGEPPRIDPLVIGAVFF